MNYDMIRATSMNCRTISRRTAVFSLLLLGLCGASVFAERYDNYPVRYQTVTITSVVAHRRTEKTDDIYLKIYENGEVRRTAVREFSRDGQQQPFNLGPYAFGPTGKVVVEVWEKDGGFRGGDDFIMKLEIYPESDILPTASGKHANIYEVKFVRN